MTDTNEELRDYAARLYLAHRHSAIVTAHVEGYRAGMAHQAQRISELEAERDSWRAALEWLFESPARWEYVFLHGDNDGTGAAIEATLICAYRESEEK